MRAAVREGRACDCGMRERIKGCMGERKIASLTPLLSLFAMSDPGAAYGPVPRYIVVLRQHMESVAARIPGGRAPRSAFNTWAAEFVEARVSDFARVRRVFADVCRQGAYLRLGGNIEHVEIVGMRGTLTAKLALYVITLLERWGDSDVRGG